MTTTVDFNLASAEFLNDPYPTYRELRRNAPVHYTDFAGGFWLVSRHSDLHTLVRSTTLHNGSDDSHHFDNLMGGPAERFAPSILNQLDGDRHTRLRKVGQAALSRRRLAQIVGPTLERQAEEAGARVVGVGAIDGLADFAHDVPLRAFCGLLHIPEADREMLYGWIQSFFGIFVPQALDETGIEHTHRAVQNFIDYLTPLIGERRKEPGEDMLSIFLTAEVDGGPVTDDEAMALVTQTMAGGFDTSSAMIAAALHCFAEIPDQIARLHDAEPGLLAAAVEEVLRWESPVQVTPRHTATETEIAGMTVPAGARLGCIVASANRDEAVFPEPDRFLLERLVREESATAPLHFGGGRHFCIGGGLARLEGEAVLRALGRHCARIERVDEPERAIPTFIRRGFTKVPVQLIPR